MNALTFQTQGQVSTLFADAQPADDLSAGIQAGFGLIGYKGKVWSIRYRGEERQLMRDDGDGPRNSIEVVILKSSAVISKVWYEVGYVEGSTAAPDCFSTNGVSPDMQSAKPQSNACASCPRNAWGSRITPAGKNGKECSDSKRMAVVPLTDLKNEVFGGPMLLRVPAASLQDLAQFGQSMRKIGYPYYSIGVRVSFDANEAYPKFEFNGIRPLTDQEAAVIIELQKEDIIDRILAEGAEYRPVEWQPVAAPATAPVVAQATVVAPAPVAATPVTPAPAEPEQLVIPGTGQVAVAPVANGGFGPMAPVTPEAAAPAATPPITVEAVKAAQAEAAPAPVGAKIPASGGFGPMATVTAEAAAPVMEGTTAASAAAAAEAAAPTPEAANFEADLDAKLDALLPKAS